LKNNKFLEQLKTLGFSLFEKQEDTDANFVLAKVAMSEDIRLWEGFPVVLANSADRDLFDYTKTDEYLKDLNDKNNLTELFAMSLALYEVLKLKKPWVNKLAKLNSAWEKEKYSYFLDKLKNNQSFKVAGYQMDSGRLKPLFKNYYFLEAQRSVEDLLVKREEFDLEYCLSQVFSPKQKELFFKKLRGQRLSKTEKEYFSRVVRKKVRALANSQLHRLAQKLTE